MNLSPNFTLAEFTATSHREVNNMLPANLMTNAFTTANMMERIRRALSSEHPSPVPIIPSSGYRCPELNQIVGGATNSDHMKMLAIDFTAPKFGTPYEICKYLESRMDSIGIGQLIYEQTWVHVGVSIPFNRVNRVLTIIPKKSLAVGIHK